MHYRTEKGFVLNYYLNFFASVKKTPINSKYFYICEHEDGCSAIRENGKFIPKICLNGLRWTQWPPVVFHLQMLTHRSRKMLGCSLIYPAWWPLPLGVAVSSEAGEERATKFTFLSLSQIFLSAVPELGSPLFILGGTKMTCLSLLMALGNILDV